jgi:flagellar motility protein MotE (MotC chaperone)
VSSRSLVVFLLFLALGVAAPTLSFGQTPSGLPPFPNANGQVKDPDQEKREHDLAKKANQERQAQLKRDTENLLKLATDLKQYVEKSNENTLSVDVIRKAEEIERLARSIKERMKGN